MRKSTLAKKCKIENVSKLILYTETMNFIVAERSVFCQSLFEKKFELKKSEVRMLTWVTKYYVKIVKTESWRFSANLVFSADKDGPLRENESFFW